MGLRFFLPLGLFVVLAALLAVGLTRDPRILPSALIDQPVPEFSLPALADREKKPAGGDGLTRDDFLGEVTLLNFFASWCGPCRLEHPLLMRLAEDGMVRLHGINWKDDPEDAVAWLEKLGDPFGRIGADPDNRAGFEFGVAGVPESFLIDAKGRIRYKVAGVLTYRELEERLLPLIADLRREEAEGPQGPAGEQP